MKRQLRIVSAVLVAAFALALPQAAHAGLITVFFSDMDNPVVVSPGVVAVTSEPGAALESVQGYSAIAGFSGHFLRQPTSGVLSVSLSNLPAHDSVDINFLLAVIDSWDGTDPTFGPDLINLRADGTLLFSDEFAFFGDPAVYSAPAGGKLTPGPPYPHLGFNGTYPDQAYNMGLEPSLLFPHTASTLLIEIFASGAGFQGGNDESFALENFQVVVNTPAGPAVPEPASLFLVGTGVAGLVAKARRRRKQQIQ